MRSLTSRTLALCFVIAGTLAHAPTADAQTSLINGFGGVAGYGTQCLSPNDDGSSSTIDLTRAFPAGLHFFTGTYTTAFVNTNGNITFNGPLPVFTPAPFPIASQPMIAPYWGDVDIRPLVSGCGGYPQYTGAPGDGPCLNPSSNGVWWHLEPARMVVTWDRVGYYSCHGDHLMSFQLVLTDASACGGPGDFDVEFRYNRCEWTTGDASGGTGGFGGTPAQAGFDAGDNAHYTAIPGSLMSNINTLLCTGSNVAVPGIWHFAIRAGNVTTDAGTRGCGVGACERVVPQCSNGFLVPCDPGPPMNEVCNNVDDDCNGMVDDGMQSCGRGECLRTVPLCEGGHMARCTPGAPQREICGNRLDDDCNGRIDDGCGTDVMSVDASDAPVDVCITGPCLLLEGRAGPGGHCTCRVPGRVPTRGVPLALAWVTVAVVIARRRLRRSAGAARARTIHARAAPPR